LSGAQARQLCWPVLRADLLSGVREEFFIALSLRSEVVVPDGVLGEAGGGVLNRERIDGTLMGVLAPTQLLSWLRR